MSKGPIAKIKLHPYNGILLLYTCREALKCDTGDGEERLSNSGITHYSDDAGIFWMGLFETTPEVIGHEAVHVAIQLLHSRGIPISAQNDETIAYLVSYIICEVNKALSKQERKLNKEVKAPKGVPAAQGVAQPIIKEVRS